MAIKTLRVFQEFTSSGYIPMPVAGNIDYGVTIANTFPSTTPSTFQTDNPDLTVTLTATTDYYVWIRSNGTDWNPMYTRNVRVYPDSALVNNVVMGIIIANLNGTVPYTGATTNVDLGTYGLKADYLQLNTSPSSIPTTQGTMAWDTTDGTANLRLSGGNVNLQVGLDSVARVVNGTTANLLRADYKAVRIIGAQGQRLQVGLALGNNDANSKDTIGLVAENINNNQEGFILTSGLLSEINSSGSLQGESWSDGDTLYLSGSTAGKITNIKPQAPIHTIIIGFVAYSHAIHGKIYVKVDNGYEIDELHNIQITSVANKNILVYDTATTLWKNRNIFGTQGYIPYYDSTLLMKDSPIYTNGTNVLLNGVTPYNSADKLTVFNGNIAVDEYYGYNIGSYRVLDRNRTTGAINLGTSVANDYLVFIANVVERARLTASGYLGLGLTNPLALLHIKGTTAYTNAIIDNNSTTGGGYYSAYQNGIEKAIFGVSGAWLLNTTSDAALIAKGTGQGIQFYTNGSTSEKMGIDADGNVFVGQTPTYTTGATQLIVRGKTGPGMLAVNHYDMSIKGGINTFNSLFQVGSTSFHSMAFLVDSVERGRVNSSGRLLWGTTTDDTVNLVQINGSLIATSIKKSGGTSSQYLMADGSISTGFSGTVTSVGLSAPTGFSVSGSPITSSGTLALSFATGYSLPSDTLQATWTSKQNALSGTGFVKSTAGTISYDTNTYYLASNPSSYISSITSLMVTNALGYTPVTSARTLTINGVTYDLSANRTWTISGGGSISGSGTINYISKWDSSSSLTNSQIYDNGSQVTIGSTVTMYKFSVNPINNSYFGIGYAGTNQIFVNAVDNSFNTVPIVNNAYSHSWLIGFGDAMQLNNAGQLLLGTTSGITGGGRLQVYGDVNITGAFRVNGSAIGTGGGGVSGSGSTNKIPKWTGGTSLGDSALYDNGSYSIGIGTTSIALPSGRNGMVIRTPNPFSSTELLIQNSSNSDGTSDGFAIANIYNDGVAIYNRANVHMRFGTNNLERLRITEDGNIGIGTTNQFGNGTKVIGIANCSITPISSPSGGGILYVENGALWYVGSSGTYTKIANA